MSRNSTQKSAATVYNHKENVQLSVQLNRWILKSIGVWPKSVNLSWIKKFMYFLVNVICIGLISFLIVPSFMYMVLEVNDAYHILKVIAHLNFGLINFVKYSSMICRENDIRKSIEQVEDDWMTTWYYDDRIIMIRNAKFSRRFVVINTIFTYSGAVFYYLYLPLKTKITENAGNLTYRPLMFPVARVIVDVRYNPANEIFFWMQCLSGFIAHSITAGACNLAVMLAMHAYGRLKVLAQWIKYLVDGREDFCGSMDKRLAMIVQQHIRILRFISLTDKILREIVFVEFLGSTLNMCLIGYLTITEWENKNVAIISMILLVSLIFNIFIVCYIGELVTDQCKKISEVTYMIDWHRLPGRNGLALILINAMSNSSVKLTVANITELSLSTFSDVVNTAVAYLNMLRTLIS